MPRYLVERLFDHISEDDMLAAATRSEEVRQEQFEDDLVWEHTHVCVESDGTVTTFCVYEAPGEDEIREHAKLFGYHVVGRVWEIVEDISPRTLQEKLGAVSRAS
jgi:hypothetical protein